MTNSLERKVTVFYINQIKITYKYQIKIMQNLCLLSN